MEEFREKLNTLKETLGNKYEKLVKPVFLLYVKAQKGDIEITDSKIKTKVVKTQNIQNTLLTAFW